MRRIAFLLFISSLLRVPIWAQDRKVTLTETSIPLISLLKKIQEQSGYTFVYSDELVSDTMMLQVSADRSPVSQVLHRILPSKGLFYQLLSRNMIIIGREDRFKNNTHSLTNVPLKGEVKDKEGAPIPFATVLLLEDTLQVNGTIANEKGEFQLTHFFRKKLNFRLKISSMGYESSIVPLSFSGDSYSFGTIYLKEKAEKLREVAVSGNQKIIEMDGGNIVFHVSRSVTTAGTNALELLSRAPGVTVGTDHHIALNGKAGAAVLIDGKQTYLSNGEIAELLKTMSASAIKSIEIIASPGAKYDAAGTAGIINVRTQKSTISGFSAAMNTGLSYGVYLRNNQDLAVNYRKNKLNVFGNYTHFIGHSSYLYGADRIQEDRFYHSFTDDIDKRRKMGTRLGADFAINNRHTIGVLLNGNFVFGGGITDTRTNTGLAGNSRIDQTLRAINDYYYQQTERYNLNVNYRYEDTLGTILNVDADYGDFSKNNANLQSNTYTSSAQEILSDRLYRSLNAIAIDMGAVKADYAKKIGKDKLETGMKFSRVMSDNDAIFLEVKPDGEFVDPERTNRFAYREVISAAYVSYQKVWRKWQFQGGLRVEHSTSEGKLEEHPENEATGGATRRNYTHWFPSFSATIKPAAPHSFSLHYSRRIDRPAYQNLNPFIYLLDELSYWQGNPFLEPQLSHRLLFQYIYKGATILGLSYTHTDKFSVEITDRVDSTRIVMVPRNLGVQQHLALTLTQTFSPLAWWSMTFNGTLFGVFNQIDFGEGRTQSPRQTAGRVSVQQNFKLPYGLNGEITGFYNSKRLNGANKFSNPISQIDVGLQRQFMQNKATLRLVYSDLYKGSKASSVQQLETLYIRNFGYFETRQVKLNFSYRFHTGQSKGPRNRSSALENEVGRIK